MRNYRQRGDLKQSKGIPQLKFNEIQALLSTITGQSNKNIDLAQKIQQFTPLNEDLICVDQLITDVNQKLMNATDQQELESIKNDCSALMDQLLNEEYNLDRIKTRLNSRVRRRVQSKNQEQVKQILKDVDVNQQQRGCLTSRDNEQNCFFQSANKKDDIAELVQNKNREKVQDGIDIEKKSITICQKQNQIQMQENLLPKKSGIEVLEEMNQRIISIQETIQLDQQNENSKLQVEIQELQQQLEQFKQNKIYHDENVQIFCVGDVPSNMRWEVFYDQE